MVASASSLPPGVNFRAEYFHQDHLGNNRLTFCDFNNNGRIEISDDPGTPENELEITQETHYYPFGLEHKGNWYAIVAPDNNYLYNGKELNRDFDINLYEYGARWYDPAIGRFTGVDPIADQFAWVNPYNYAENEPIANIDLHGLQSFYAANGSIVHAGPISNSEIKKRNLSKIPIVSREQWRARALITGSGRSYEKIKGSLKSYYNSIVIHHSGNEGRYKTVSGVQDEHMDGASKKADIGYHFAIGKGGEIYEGRPIDVKGAHVNLANTGKIDIVLLADLDTEDQGLNFIEKLFETSDGELTPEMGSSLITLLSYLVNEYDIQELGGHNEVNCERYCPGNLIEERLQELRDRYGLDTPIGETGNN
ncbi:MAG: N-acetylmuramoyl-L-alanine amidase [Chitinophagales bacterium]|nr:N-acetylmuramoyl-L-alanine amidase [Chitinophagales bacterium]